MCCTHAVHLLHTCCTPAVHPLYTATHVLYTWYTHAVHLLAVHCYTCAVHMLYTCCTPATHMLYTCYTYAVHLLHTCSTGIKSCTCADMHCLVSCLQHKFFRHSWVHLKHISHNYNYFRTPHHTTCSRFQMVVHSEGGGTSSATLPPLWSMDCTYDCSQPYTTQEG